MTERLATLVEKRARWLVIAAAFFFAISAALGAGVAGRLDPFGVDDPETESVIADERLERAGFRETGVVVLIETVLRARATVASGSGRSRAHSSATPTSPR